MLVLVCAAVVLAPLLIVPHWSFYFDTAPKAAVLLAAASLLQFGIARMERGFSALWRDRLGRWYLLLSIAQTASLLLSALCGADPVLSLFGSGWHRFGVVEQCSILTLACCTAALIAENPRNLAVLLRSLCIPTIVIAAYSLLQYSGVDPLVNPSLYTIFMGPFLVIRPPSTLGHAAHLANFMVGIAGCSIAWLGESRSRGGKALAILCAFLAAVAVLISGTRSGIVGLGVMGILLLIGLRSRLTRGHLAIAAALLLPLGLFCISPAGRGVRDRTEAWMRTDLTGGPRRLLWRDTIAMARARLVKGYGSEMFSGEFPRVVSTELARAYPESYFESSHNLFLDLLIAQGLCGPLLQIGMFAAAFVGAARRRFDVFAVAMLSALAGLVAAEQFVHSVLPTQLILALIPAILVGRALRASEELSRPRGRRMLAAAGLPVSAIFAVTAANVAIVDSGWASVKRALERHDPAAAVLTAARTRSFGPRESGAELWYSRALLDATRESTDSAVRARAWGDAVSAATQGSATYDNRANALFNVAALHWTAGEMEQADAATRAALLCAPNWYKPHWLMAEILHARGQTGEAATEFRRAEFLAGPHEPDLEEASRRILFAH